MAATLQDLQFPQSAFQPLTPAAQGLVDGLGRGRQASLQDGQGKADGTGALVVFQGFGAVELLAHVVGDSLVEVRFGIRQPVGNGMRDSLRE